MGKAFRKEKESKVDGDIDFADSDSDLGSLSSEGERSGNEDDDSGSDEEGDAKWKENMHLTAQKLRGTRRSYRTADLAKLMYDESLTPAEVLRRWRGEIDEE